MGLVGDAENHSSPSIPHESSHYLVISERYSATFPTSSTVGIECSEKTWSCTTRSVAQGLDTPSRHLVEGKYRLNHIYSHLNCDIT